MFKVLSPCRGSDCQVMGEKCLTKWSIYGLKEQCQMPVSLMLIQETAKNFCSEAYRPSLVEMLPKLCQLHRSRSI